LAECGAGFLPAQSAVELRGFSLLGGESTYDLIALRVHHATHTRFLILKLLFKPIARKPLLQNLKHPDYFGIGKAIFLDVIIHLSEKL
jgi:hypothetical protein